MTGRIVVTGAGGMLGKALIRELQKRRLDHVGFTHQGLDVANSLEGIRDTDTVINAAGIVRGRDVPEETYMAVNAAAPHGLAVMAERVIQVSTDCVFDGEDPGEYTEYSKTNPPDLYARSKFMGEVTHTPHLTVRTSFIGLGDRGLVRWLLDTEPGSTVDGWASVMWNGLYVGSLATILVDLALRDDLSGVLHVAGEITSKLALILMIAETLELDLVVNPVPLPVSDMVLSSDRPEAKDIHVPTLKDMMRYLKHDYRRYSRRA